MKKKIYLLLLLSSQSISAYQTFGPMLFSALFFSDKGCNVSIAPTLSWWRIRKSFLYDVSGNKDYVQGNNPKVVPGICIDINREFYRREKFKTTEKITKPRNFFYRLFFGDEKSTSIEKISEIVFNMGIRFNYQKRHQACVTDFYEEGNSVSSFEIRQDVNNIRFSPYCQAVFDLKKFMITLTAAPSFSFKAFDKLEIWEKATTAYTGQRLKPDKINLMAEFETGIKVPCRHYGFFTINYGLMVGAIRYGRRIYIDTPGDNASEQFEDQLFLTDKDSLYTSRIPKLKIFTNTLSIGFQKDF